MNIQPVIIPIKISEQAIKLNKANLLAFLFALKSTYSGGAIKNVYSRLNELAKYARVHKKTVKKYLDELVKVGWAKFANNGTLMVIGKDKLCKEFGLNYDHIMKYAYSYKGHKDMKAQLRVFAINDNLAKQEAKVIGKLKNTLKDKSKKESRKAVQLERHDLKGKLTLSQRGIGRVYGKSSFSGAYWSNKLVKLNKLKVRSQESIIRCEDMSKQCFIALRNVHPERSLVWSNGKVYERLPNKIEVLF